MTHPYADQMPERELQENVRLMAKAFGIRYYHTHSAMNSPAGFPDVVLVKPPACMFRELKSATGKMSDTQTAWIADLIDCGLDADVWRPVDWFSGRIKAEMAGMA